MGTDSRAVSLPLLLLVALVAVSPQFCDARTFKKGQSIPVYANRVGPYHNPTETYQYYNLPFCQPSGGKQYKLLDLGEVGGRFHAANCGMQAWVQAHMQSREQHVGVMAIKDDVFPPAALCLRTSSFISHDRLFRCSRGIAWSVRPMT